MLERDRFEETKDPQDFLRWLTSYTNRNGRDQELHALCSSAHEVVAELQNKVVFQPLPPERCSYCGDLTWTVNQYGRITHKEQCPMRVNGWHQGMPHFYSDGQDARGRKFDTSKTPA